MGGIRPWEMQGFTPDEERAVWAYVDELRAAVKGGE